jgi:predicted alpha/beta superfamily hydrolase
MKSIQFSFVFLVFLLSCASKPQSLPQDPIPNHDNFTLESTILGETRVINVWTPPDYQDSSKNFPVLYMPDGGINEDFPHIANTLAELVQAKSIPPILLIGIENTVRRRDLSGFSETEYDKQFAPQTDGAKEFRAFISDELMPEITKRYRTTEKKGIVGESLAGLFVMETFMLKPELFDFYIAMDPSIWWNDHNLVKTASEHLKNLPKTEKRLWFAGSSAEDIAQYTRQLATVIKTDAPENLIWMYSDEPNEKHNTIFRATKVKAFKWAMGNQ